MKVHELDPKSYKKYENFVENHPLGSIHQTREWALFQTKTPGRDKFWILVLEDNDQNIVASALLIRQTLPFQKSWLYSPRGPLVDYNSPEHLNLLFSKIKELAAEQQAVFMRFDPAIAAPKIPFEQNPPAIEESTLIIMKKVLHTQPAHAHYQPQYTLVLDLEQNEENLLKQMKPKGRYNIKVAQKHNITISLSTQETLKKDVEIFYNLLKQTTSRDEFSGHNQKYYEDMIETLGTKKAKIYLAYYEQRPVAGIIVTHFKDTAIYYFGASSNEDRNTMAPYLLQWKAIQDAKKADFKNYDFLGIAPENSPNHPWAGVTDFKLKFGGDRVNYIEAQEIIYKPFWYFLIKIAKKLLGKAA